MLFTAFGDALGEQGAHCVLLAHPLALHFPIDVTRIAFMMDLVTGFAVESTRGWVVHIGLEDPRGLF